jgi:hypothetical protein
MGLRGFFMGSIMGSQNIMRSDYGSNISVWELQGDSYVMPWVTLQCYVTRL